MLAAGYVGGLEGDVKGEWDGRFLANMFRSIELGVTLSLGGCGLVGVERASLNGLEGDMDTDD